MAKDDGAMWIRVSSKTNQEFLSGVIEINGNKYNFAAFKNRYKEEGDRKPDYTIKLSEKRDDNERNIPF